MSSWHRSGAAVLLVVLCVIDSFSAAQMWQGRVTPLTYYFEPIVRVARLEPRVEDVQNTLTLARN